jgi:hypothetical protein
MIVHRISAVSLVALKSENLSMVGTGSYDILCIEYTLHYSVTSLVRAREIFGMVWLSMEIIFLPRELTVHTGITGDIHGMMQFGPIVAPQPI